MYFSIIIPTYNRSSVITQTIQSVLNQPFEDFEVIVVDDGSSDDTESVIHSIKDERIRYFKTGNQERGAARNFGAAQSNGLYLNFFDSDDLFLPCLAHVYTFLEHHNRPPLLFGLFDLIDDKGNTLNKSVSYQSGSFTKRLLHNNFLACGSVLVKRDIAVNFPFDANRKLSSAEDWELWLRLHAKYDFVEFPYRLFRQVQHIERSLRTIKATRIQERDEYFANVVISNNELLLKYGRNNLLLFMANRFTFIALSYAEENKFQKAYIYLRKAFYASPSVIGSKRFWAVLKKIILK